MITAAVKFVRTISLRIYLTGSVRLFDAYEHDLSIKV